MHLAVRETEWFTRNWSTVYGRWVGSRPRRRPDAGGRAVVPFTAPCRRSPSDLRRGGLRSATVALSSLRRGQTNRSYLRWRPPAPCRSASLAPAMPRERPWLSPRDLCLCVTYNLPDYLSDSSGHGFLFSDVNSPESCWTVTLGYAPEIDWRLDRTCGNHQTSNLSTAPTDAREIWADWNRGEWPRKYPCQRLHFTIDHRFSPSFFLSWKGSASGGPASADADVWSPAERDNTRWGDDNENVSISASEVYTTDR
jgi:hypothetical protein